MSHQRSSGLAFFGTPHAGGSDALVNLGKASIRIVRGLFRNPPNDIMQAVTHGSLYADVLQENWRHQLNLYKIVSFYEGIGSVRPRNLPLKWFDCLLAHRSFRVSPRPLDFLGMWKISFVLQQTMPTCAVSISPIMMIRTIFSWFVPTLKSCMIRLY